MSEQVQPAYALRPYQRQVFHDLMGAVLEPRWDAPRVVAHLPTGAGKTRIACHVAAALLNRAQSEGKIVVWLASSEELCEQAAESLAEAWTHVGNRKATLHRYWGTRSLGAETLSDGFLVASLSKLWASGSRQTGFLAKVSQQAASVILDEAHQAVAPTYKDVIEQVIAHDAPLIGLTATPGRTARGGTEDYDLAAMFNERKVGIDPRGHGSAVRYLIVQGYLADPEFVAVDAGLGEVGVRDPRAGADYSHDDLRAVGGDGAWFGKIVEMTLQALERHRRVMVFCPSVQCAEAAARAVLDAGRKAASIVADTGVDDRHEAISAFRDGGQEPMALFNYAVLTAGFDAPRTSCVIIARPTTSLVLYAQMAGRAMRGPHSGGNRTCQIYTVVDTSLPGFGSVVEAFGYWEALWKQADSS